MTDHPKRIGTSYAGQFSRPEDAIRERENEQRKADLEAVENLDPDEMPVAIYNQAFQDELDELEKYAAEDATTNGGQRVDEAIARAVTAAARAEVQHCASGRPGPSSTAPPSGP